MMDQPLPEPSGGARRPRPGRSPDRPRGASALVALVAVLSAAATAVSWDQDAYAQACPPYCATPIITPAWHLHMCDEAYEDQSGDNHCMDGPGVTEFGAGTDRVWVIYCHKYSDTVVVQIRDTGGGLQWVNHPDGITYQGEGCESMPFSMPNGIPPAGSPYRTSAYWPEGPFSGVAPGIEWYIGLFIAFDADNYYGNDATAQITARDPAANTSPAVRDVITATVTSDSDPVGVPVRLEEELPGFPIFKTVRPLRFSQTASDPLRSVIRVKNRDKVTVTYCPRDCATPYVDVATWYQLDATITPTPLPTWPGPPPTVTPTPPPQLDVEYAALRPWPQDVGYAPLMTNKGRPNHLGYPNMFVGMWTRGRNPHRGMVQFDLSDLPEGAAVIEARLEVVGRNGRFLKPGEWHVELLDAAIDDLWRDATYEQVAGAPVIGQIGPTLHDFDLGEGRSNAAGFDPSQVGWLNERLRSTRRVSFRIDGPEDEDNLFSWETGVDVYGRASEPPDPALGPVLHLTYVVPRDGPAPTATASSVPPPATSTPTGTATSPPTPPGGATATAGGPPTATATAGAPSATPAGGATVTATAASGATATAGAPPTATLPGASTATLEPPPTATVPGGTAATATATTSGGPTATTGAPPTASATVPGGATATSGTGPSATPSATPGGGAATATPPPPPTPGGPTSTATPLPTPTATSEGPLVGRQVCLLAFEDLNADGRRQLQERLLPGVTVRLTHLESGAFVTWTTDGANEPDYCWAGLTDGDYRIAVVELPAGYRSTGLVERSFAVPFTVPSVQHEFGAARPPSPTPSRVPTATGTATVPPTPTPRPSPTMLPTVSGPQGLLCVLAFLDADEDGFRSPGESLVPDHRIDVQDEGRRTVRGLLTVTRGPVCAPLPVGVYYAHAIPAAGFDITTSGDQAVLLTAGDERTLAFGVRRRLEIIYLPFAVTAGRR